MTDPIEIMARAILNSDRVAGGWPPVESRDGIPDSDGYVRNAADLIAGLATAGFAIVPVEPSEAMVEEGCAAYWPVEEFCTGPITNGERAVRAYRAMIEAGSVKA